MQLVAKPVYIDCKAMTAREAILAIAHNLSLADHVEHRPSLYDAQEWPEIRIRCRHAWGLDVELTISAEHNRHGTVIETYLSLGSTKRSAAQVAVLVRLLGELSAVMSYVEATAGGYVWELEPLP